MRAMAREDRDLEGLQVGANVDAPQTAMIYGRAVKRQNPDHQGSWPAHTVIPGIYAVGALHR